MKKIRVSNVTSKNATLISNFKQKIGKISNKIKVDQQTIRKTPTTHPRDNAKHRGEKSEAIYAEPVPRRCLESLTAEENIHHRGMRRGLPIEKIRIIAAELRKISQKRQQN